MPLKVQSRDMVVVGRFNPHIINPEWLRREEICESRNVNVEFGFNLDERRGIFQFVIGDFRWQVTDSRLLISSRDENPSEMAAKVLEKLPHTPITAVGHNCLYRSESTEGMRLPQIGELDAATLTAGHDWKVSQLTWSCVLQLVKATFSMKVVKLVDAVEVTTNVHRDATDVGQVIEISKGFVDDMESSKKMITSILGVTI